MVVPAPVPAPAAAGMAMFVFPLLPNALPPVPNMLPVVPPPAGVFPAPAPDPPKTELFVVFAPKFANGLAPAAGAEPGVDVAGFLF